MSQANKTKQSIEIRIPIPKIPNEKAKRIPIGTEEYETIKRLENQKLFFSFRLLSMGHELFNLGGTCTKWFITLITHLKEVSELTRNDLFIIYRNHYDAHRLDWEDTSCKFPFDDDFLNQCECAQFRLTQGAGRVHGVIIGSCFYVVWLDPHHNMYPKDSYGGLKYFERTPTCFETMREENLRLICENKVLNELLNEKCK